MASLFKKPTTHRNPKTGKREAIQSHKWWGRYRDENGVDRRVPLAADKAAAQAMLAERVQQTERKAAGIVDRFDEQRKRPVEEHIEEFE